MGSLVSDASSATSGPIFQKLADLWKVLSDLDIWWGWFVRATIVGSISPAFSLENMQDKVFKDQLICLDFDQQVPFSNFLLGKHLLSRMITKANWWKTIFMDTESPKDQNDKR